MCGTRLQVLQKGMSRVLRAHEAAACSAAPAPGMGFTTLCQCVPPALVLLLCAVRHMHICSCRGRLFLLQPGPPTPLKGQAGQARIDTVFRQIAASTSPPPDSTAPAAYALAVRGCCSLMLQGRSGPAAVLASEAQNALLSSCGVPLGQVQQAVQQHLLAPGSVCAESVIQALQLKLQHLQEHTKIARVSSTQSHFRYRQM